MGKGWPYWFEIVSVQAMSPPLSLRLLHFALWGGMVDCCWQERSQSHRIIPEIACGALGTYAPLCPAACLGLCLCLPESVSVYILDSVLQVRGGLGFSVSYM